MKKSPFVHISPYNIYKTSGQSPALTVDEKMQQWEKENPNPFAEMDALIQKKTKRMRKVKTEKPIISSKQSAATPQINVSGILDFLKGNNYFLRK